MKAFPTTYRNYDESIDYDCTGMDLRDYFAAKAMPLAFKVWENYHLSDENDATYKTSNFQADGNYLELIANTAYQMADAMIESKKIKESK
jgi:hypothetical protein